IVRVKAHPRPGIARGTALVRPTRVVARVARVGALALPAMLASPLVAQRSSGPPNGTLIVDGGGATDAVVRRFVELAGGAQARIVAIATAPSAIRFGPDNIVLNPDWPRERKEWS